jgi:hypothetical protein
VGPEPARWKLHDASFHEAVGMTMGLKALGVKRTIVGRMTESNRTNEKAEDAESTEDQHGDEMKRLAAT